jgi:hypothetical protein
MCLASKVLPEQLAPLSLDQLHDDSPYADDDCASWRHIQGFISKILNSGVLMELE